MSPEGGWRPEESGGSSFFEGRVGKGDGGVVEDGGGAMPLKYLLTCTYLPPLIVQRRVSKEVSMRIRSRASLTCSNVVTMQSVLPKASSTADATASSNSIATPTLEAKE